LRYAIVFSNRFEINNNIELNFIVNNSCSFEIKVSQKEKKL